MLENRFNTIGTFIFATICIILGILTITAGSTLFRYDIYLIAFCITGLAFIDLIKAIMDINHFKKIVQAFIKFIIEFIFSSLMIEFNHFIIASITVFFGCYIFAHSLLHLFNFYLYKINNIRGRFNLFIQFLFTFILALLLILHPNKNLFFAEIIVGLYFIFLGITKLIDFIKEIIPVKYSNFLKSHIQIQLPILIAMFIPKQLIRNINKSLETNSESNFLVEKKKNKPDIEVIIHLANSGTASFGHVEVCFDHKIYSFGNYNPHSRILFNSIGDGIICIADRDRYIEYALNNKNRYLVVFGMQLTEKEKTIIKNRIYHLVHDNTVDFYPDLALYERGELEKGEYHDMSSEIYKLANGRFKKIIKGKNKKFFVLKTNCVMVANYILNGKDVKLAAINGIISPGAYYDYLNNEFMKKDSNVITRKIYTRETIEKL